MTVELVCHMGYQYAFPTKIDAMEAWNKRYPRDKESNNL
jgi:hypothetical protein